MQKPQRTFLDLEKTSLAIAAGLTWTVLQLYPPAPANRYLAYRVVLPAAWMVALLCQRKVRSMLASAFDRLQPTVRIMVGGSVAAIVLAYTVIVVSRMPAPVTRVPIKDSIGSIGTTTPDIVILPDSPDADRRARKSEDKQADAASQPSNEAQAQEANAQPGAPASVGSLRIIR